MKKIVCLLAFATLSAALPAYSQSATDDAVSNMSAIRRPTPKPGASPGTSTAKAAGPMEVALYKDAEGKSATTSFSPTDTIYVAGKNVTVAKGDKVGVNWYGKGDKKLTQSEITAPDAGSVNPKFHLSAPPKGTPAGSYRADFVQNGKVIKRLPFTVK